MRTPTCVAAALIVAAVAATPAFGGAWLSKGAARAVAVDVTADTCRAVGWCRGYEVVPARRCRRAADRTVYCRVGFLTAGRQRCGGVVAVSKTRRGRIDPGMAVPQNCAQEATTPV